MANRLDGKPLSESAKSAYVDKGGTTGGADCPYCGGSDLAACAKEGPDHEAAKDVDCENCGRQWVEVFVLYRIEEVKHDEGR